MVSTYIVVLIGFWGKIAAAVRLPELFKYVSTPLPIGQSPGIQGVSTPCVIVYIAGGQGLGQDQIRKALCARELGGCPNRRVGDGEQPRVALNPPENFLELFLPVSTTGNFCENYLHC